jgi:hypothetical protein
MASTEELEQQFKQVSEKRLYVEELVKQFHRGLGDEKIRLTALLTGLQEYFRDVEEAKLFQRIASLVNAEKLMVDLETKISDLQVGVSKTTEAYTDASTELSLVLQSILKSQQKIESIITPVIAKLTANLDDESIVLGLIKKELGD